MPSIVSLATGLPTGATLPATSRTDAVKLDWQVAGDGAATDTLLVTDVQSSCALIAIVTAWCRALLRQPHNAQDASLGWTLLAATIPLVIAGVFLEELVATTLRSPLVIAAATAFFGILLWVADRRPDRVARLGSVNLRAGVLIGLAQVLALIPGTSRSGITMTAGLALGLDRKTAARFSFLLAIPAIAGAALLETLALVQSADPVPWSDLLLGLVMAAASAWLCIHLFLEWIQRIGMVPFVVYRLLLAAVILAVFW